MSKTKTYLKTIILPILIGGIIGLITSSSMNDFKMLTKPILAPPGILFPIVWTILYILMGVSYGIILTNNLDTPEIKKTYYAQLFVNALWPIIFFSLKLRFLALIWLLLLLGLVIRMIYLFYQQKKVAGLLQIPYLLWLLFATYLNLFIWLLNR